MNLNIYVMTHIITREQQHWLLHSDKVTVQLTWDTQAPVAVAHAAAHSVGAGVEGAEVHQLSARGAGEARRAATAEAQGSRALRVACGIIVTGVGGTWVHFVLTCSRLIT